MDDGSEALIGFVCPHCDAFEFLELAEEIHPFKAEIERLVLTRPRTGETIRHDLLCPRPRSSASSSSFQSRRSRPTRLHPRNAAPGKHSPQDGRRKSGPISRDAIPTSILRTGVLFAPGLGKISFTRSPEVAAYLALQKRHPDEGRGAILLFDRNALGCRYAIIPVHEKWVEVGGRYWHDEAEEEVWTDIVNISRYLIGHVPTKEGDYSGKGKQLNRSDLKKMRRYRKALRDAAAHV
jgi:hypothetical protein